MSKCYSLYPGDCLFFRTTLTREIALHCKTFLTDKVRIPPPHGFIIRFFFPPTVTVVLWKPVFFTHPHRYIAHLNRDGFAAVTLSCEARGFPTPVISWLQDKTLLKSDSTVTQNGDTSSLTVVFTTETEQPLKYRCLANNSMGKTWSKEGEVTIVASAQRKIPVSDDNSSSSLGISKAVGISIPIGSAFFNYQLSPNSCPLQEVQKTYHRKHPNGSCSAISKLARACKRHGHPKRGINNTTLPEERDGGNDTAKPKS